MAGGRPRKVVSASTGKIGKDARAFRAEQESKLKVSRDELRPPEYLAFAAKAEFVRVVNAAEAIGLLDNLDLSILAIYADAWHLYMQASTAVAQEGMVYDRISSKGESNITLSPYVTAMEKYARLIMSCSAKLGLATTDRLKLIVPEKEVEENKFLKYAK